MEIESRPGATSDDVLSALPHAPRSFMPLRLPNTVPLPDRVGKTRLLPEPRLPALSRATMVAEPGFRRTRVAEVARRRAAKSALVRFAVPAEQLEAVLERAKAVLGAQRTQELYPQWHMFELPQTLTPEDVEQRLDTLGVPIMFEPDRAIDADVLWWDPLLQPSAGGWSQYYFYNVGQWPGSPYDHDVDADEAWDVTAAWPMYVTTAAVMDQAPEYWHGDAPRWSHLCRMSQTSVGDLTCYGQAYNGAFSHGTHVSGIIGAHAGNQFGMSGINWASQIMSLDVSIINDGRMDYYGILNSLRFAADNGAGVINMSFGGPGTVGTNATDPMWAALEYANSRDLQVVIAAGNSNQWLDCGNTGCQFWPASYNNYNVITVGATDPAFYRAPFSNYGATVDISAPGMGIVSTVNGNSFAAWDGTSMAAPIVAGIFSMVKSLRPYATPYVMQSCMSYMPIPQLAGANRLSGVISAKGAADCAVSFGETTPPPVFNVTAPAHYSQNPRTVTFQWQAAPDFYVRYQLFVDGRFVATTGGTAYTVSNLTDGQHTFYVRASDSYGNFRNSTHVFTFFVDATPPSAFSLSSPAAGAATSASQTFSWQAAADANPVTYELYVDSVLRARTSGTAYSVAGLAQGAHWWHVRAVDSLGNARSTSMRSFTVDATAPLSPGMTRR
ncbi:S8 family serine peptidase [Corallococcus exiguus]|uniref:S8 family serine peptidase n=1 Tax=Corallococcus exiguus TaxID=83462 RepID=UPI001A8F5032|nr:S8 family serine peptidase [Corallococcus exiguus]MBN8467639.1 S8 family serine peptidase [Corallococcus exiguus]